MCGIAGLLDFSQALCADAQETIGRAMGAAMAHRGPDGDDTWHDAEAGVVLVHRRLAVIDPRPEARQPFSDASGRFVMTYNGEIYNYRSLRQNLASAGTRFRTESDTEVLVEALARWGTAETLRRAEGIFAFALWDRQVRRLTLARDGFGVKPLYVGHFGQNVLFASEIRAMEAVDGWTRRIDRDAVAGLLSRNCIPAPHAIYKGLNKLPPGHFLEIESDGRTVENRFWSVEDVAAAGLADPFDPRDPQVAPAIWAAFSQSVSDQLVSDVPVGLFLSGGLDSSAIATALSEIGPSRMPRSYSLGFEEKQFDESAQARAIATHLGLSHTELTVSEAEAQQIVPDLASIYDEPFADSSQIPTALISRLARQDTTVVLSGDGGDELFGGYDRYRFCARVWQRLERLPLPLRRAGGKLADLSAGVPFLPKLLDAFLPRASEKRWGDLMSSAASVLPMENRDDLYARVVEHWRDPLQVVLGADRGIAALGEVADRSDGFSFGHWMRLIDCVTYLPDDLLTKVDRATMAASLEGRVPFLDRSLAALAWRLPEEMLWGRGDDGCDVGKRLLRTLVAERLPPSLLSAEKRGFAVPLATWLRGPLRDWAEDLLSETRLKQDGLFDAARVRAAWNRHVTREADLAYWIWDVLMMNAWLDAGPGRKAAL